jgi:hypothetical protein
MMWHAEQCAAGPSWRPSVHFAGGPEWQYAQSAGCIVVAVSGLTVWQLTQSLVLAGCACAHEVVPLWHVVHAVE